MKVIIVEDEPTASKHLKDILERSGVGVSVLAVLPSVEETVSWIQNNPKPQLGFFDIQLADDLSFQIFKKCKVSFPVVFTTAFEDYLLKAFEYHAIHYLLKPIQQAKVSRVLEKVKEMKQIFASETLEDLSGKTTFRPIRERLIVRKENAYISLEISQIAYFFLEHNLTFVRDFSGATYLTDYSLVEVDKYMDPSKFFRVNRQYLVHISAIKRFKSIDQSKISLLLHPNPDKQIVISKEQAVHFRKWIHSL